MRKILIPVLAILFSCSQSNTQNQTIDDPLREAKERFAKMEADALSEPYNGIFTDAGRSDGLFSISATGVSTAPIVNSATDFLNSLTSEQLERTTFEFDDEEWRKWCNVDNGIYNRQGISLKEMTDAQKQAAFHLMQNSLSAKGLQLSRDIMKTDQTLKEINSGSPIYDEELYFFTVMGTPSTSEPWGWQIDGHHLVINYFVLGDQVVMSPVFMGAEPVITTSGKYEGNSLFQDEQNLGLALMRSLGQDLQSKAIIEYEKTHDNNVAAANKDNLTLNYEGVCVLEFDEQQRQDLLDLAAEYINNLREGHQQIKMEEIIKHLDETWFAWVGKTDEEAVFYYRIHSPVVLIEFDHQIPVGVPGADMEAPTRNHIHTVVRTPNGNDYGKDLLRQHLETHHH